MPPGIFLMETAEKNIIFKAMWKRNWKGTVKWENVESPWVNRNVWEYSDSGKINFKERADRVSVTEAASYRLVTTDLSAG